MVDGPEFHPERPEEPDYTRKHPMGTYEGDDGPPAAAERGDSPNDMAESRNPTGRPYGGDPDPDDTGGELPGEWHEHRINKPEAGT